MPKVTVIGRDGGPLSPAALDAVSRATLLIGAERHLSDVESAVDKIVLGPLDPALRRLISHGGDAVVLASGDPAFFGIVRRLRAIGIEPIVYPAVSSVAMAFARAGLPWDDALVVSAHGRDLRRAVNACRAHPKVAVLTGPGCGPAELAHHLTDLDRTFIVAECLGMPTERLSTVDADAAAARQWADPNVVLVLHDHSEARPAIVCPAPLRSRPPWVAGAGAGPDGWALPEGSFAHRDSMITKAEVRALVLARLGPRLGDLVWDVGAGSGSVAVECARFGAAVIAIDRDPVTAPRITQNTAGLGVQVITANAPQCLVDLPDPDAVFVGGGGLDVLAACAARGPSRLVTALAALDRVSPGLRAMEEAGYRAEGVALQASRLSPLPDGSHRLAATNPVFVLSGVLS